MTFKVTQGHWYWCHWIRQILFPISLPLYISALYRLDTQLFTSVSDLSSFEPSSVTLQLSHSKLSLFNIYRPPSSFTYSKPFSVFLNDFSSFLSFAATTPHKFIITGDFNIHLHNPADTLTSQFLSLLSSLNFSQHVYFPTHDKNHILDLVITSYDTSLARLSLAPIRLHPTTFLSSPDCL